MSNDGFSRRTLLAGAGAATLGAAGVGGALYTGFGPAPGGDSGDEIEEFPTEEPSENGDEEEAEETDGESDDGDPFVFAIDEIEECGQTCRDVTATLHNQQSEPATGVTTYTRMYAGEDNTDSDDLVWEGSVEVGDLEADGSHTSTERVELSLQEARKIDGEDGWVTILTSVDTDETTVTFQDSEQVA